ncbi:hypothetical protein GUJ93_ZPchr0002g25460 [Zizania palustris]|uniref:Uncharacterized protein n=1 Tax=Zizania palustris TaxID=103762 RepID=A0A8J5VGZ4_ZIZPA|nr:hypothetical protein GUJ93_ZPchr0002g25460 [Zizania palustris]
MGFPPSFLFATPDLKPELKKITFPFFATPDAGPPSAAPPSAALPSSPGSPPARAPQAGVWTPSSARRPAIPPSSPRERASLAPLPPERASPAPLPPERHRFERERSRERDGGNEIKVVMELSKKMRLDLGGATLEPAKPPERPLAGAVKDGQTEPAPSREKNHVPHTEKMVEETQSSEFTDHPKELDEIAAGSCVTGGSPIGWNFVVWPGGKAVYYGLTKEEFLARQAAN